MHTLLNTDNFTSKVMAKSSFQTPLNSMAFVRKPEWIHTPPPLNRRTTEVFHFFSSDKLNLEISTKWRRWWWQLKYLWWRYVWTKKFTTGKKTSGNINLSLISHKKTLLFLYVSFIELAWAPPSNRVDIRKHFHGTEVWIDNGLVKNRFNQADEALTGLETSLAQIGSVQLEPSQNELKLVKEAQA